MLQDQLQLIPFTEKKKRRIGRSVSGLAFKNEQPLHAKARASLTCDGSPALLM
jgi:hypothetical protein